MGFLCCGSGAARAPGSLDCLSKVWLVASSLVVAVDATYVIFRPQTQGTGAYPFQLWDLYATYDMRYAAPAATEGFVVLQSWLNYVEVALALLVVVLNWIAFRDDKGCVHRAAVAVVRVACNCCRCCRCGGRSRTSDEVVECIRSKGCVAKTAAVVSLMTLYKTVIYLLLEVFEGHKYTGHNSREDAIKMVFLPSAVWILLPAYVAIRALTGLSTAAPADADLVVVGKRLSVAPSPRNSTGGSKGRKDKEEVIAAHSTAVSARSSEAAASPKAKEASSPKGRVSGSRARSTSSKRKR